MIIMPNLTLIHVTGDGTLKMEKIDGAYSGIYLTLFQWLPNEFVIFKRKLE